MYLYRQVFDGDDHATAIWGGCGQRPEPFLLVSTTREMQILMFVSESLQFEGFQASYSQISGGNNRCLDSQYVQISLAYPDRDYALSCDGVAQNACMLTTLEVSDCFVNLAIWRVFVQATVAKSLTLLQLVACWRHQTIRPSMTICWTVNGCWQRMRAIGSRWLWPTSKWTPAGAGATVAVTSFG